jgi:DNA-binding NarL/FixJ family response regulator
MQTNASVLETIWLADDDADDRLVFEIAIKEISPQALLHTIDDGLQLIKQLNATTILPHLLFLDLNMPCKNGKECLAEIREIKRFKALPIVVYSSSDQVNDVNHAYGLGANLYVKKPGKYGDMVRLLKEVLHLNWKDPKGIAIAHFIGNNYVPFRSNARKPDVKPTNLPSA